MKPTPALQTIAWSSPGGASCPGADIGRHVQAHDCVVVPLTSGTICLQAPNGTRDTQPKAGNSYARPRGFAHKVINVNPLESPSAEIALNRRMG